MTPSGRRPVTGGRSGGFSLMEMLITVVILGIVVSIGYPSYLEQTKRTRRTEATAALLNIAAAQEKFYLQNNAYTDVLGNGGLEIGATTESGYYDLEVELPAGGGFLATATLAGGNSDEDCDTFTLDHTGTRGAQSDGDPATASCWR